MSKKNAGMFIYLIYYIVDSYRNNTAYRAAVIIKIEHGLYLELTKDTPYLTLVVNSEWLWSIVTIKYRKISDIRRTQTQNLKNDSRLIMQLPLPNALKPGDAPTTSEWSTILLPSKVRLILETWRYLTQRKIMNTGMFILFN